MPNNQQSITNNKPKWKWSSGEEVNIEDLTLLETAKAAIHCMKRIRNYSDKVAFYEYKKKIARTEVQIDKSQNSIGYCNKMVLFFSDKLDELSAHAISKHNVEIPHEFDNLKKLLSEIDKKHEPTDNT